MARRRRFLFLLGAAAAVVGAVAMIRHFRGSTRGRRVPGGVLVGDAVTYDALTHRLLLGSFFKRIAEDVAAVATEGARVLEVGCGPGHLSILLARRHGLDVTGLDLDEAMIERARANADRPGDGDQRRPSFLVGDVASLRFPDRSFDLVLSTLSMHHWADPAAGLAEIGRVLRPNGRALIWDLRPGIVPFHRDVSDPLQHMHGSQLRIVSATPWRWPWRLSLAQRIELVRADGIRTLGNMGATSGARMTDARGDRPQPSGQIVDPGSIGAVPEGPEHLGSLTARRPAGERRGQSTDRVSLPHTARRPASDLLILRWRTA